MNREQNEMWAESVESKMRCEKNEQRAKRDVSRMKREQDKM